MLAVLIAQVLQIKLVVPITQYRVGDCTSSLCDFRFPVGARGWTETPDSGERQQRDATRRDGSACQFVSCRRI